MFISNDELNGLNLLNFLNSQRHMIRAFESFTHHEFLGFIEDETFNSIGISFDNKRYCALHSFYNNEPYSNGWSINDKYICKAKPYVFMILGCDNTSYFGRFKDYSYLYEALSYLINRNDSVIYNDDIIDLFYFNS